MEQRDVEAWVDRYEQAWRTPSTDRLADLFAPEVTYLPSPWGRPVQGLDALATFWDSERAGADEEFTMTRSVVAVDGDTAVVRVEVEYAAPGGRRWRDLWVIRFAPDGRCAEFEEWPFAPDQADGH